MKGIVIYYSFGGNTRGVAEMIRERTHCDIAEIKTVALYTGSYNDVVRQAKKEIESGYMPDIIDINVNLSQYDTIFLGTPVWWYTYAPPIGTFLKRHDLSGKTVYPFATNGGWAGHTFKDIAAACSGADVRPGKDIEFNESALVTPKARITEWIDNCR